MILKIKNGVCHFQFPNLANYKRLVHGVFTRVGGSSEKPFDSLNTSGSDGDSPADVRRNRETISECLDNGMLMFANQTHGTEYAVFSDRGWEPDENPPRADATITNIRNRNLVIQTADCQAVLLYDPVRHVAANIHSGWRGSVGNIVGKTADAMKTRFGCDPTYMLAGIGPSLGPCCAEFVNYENEIPESFWKYMDRKKRFDFWSASRDQLADSGVLPKNIVSSDICTRCNTNLFYSYRGEGRTGRFASVIGLK